MALANGIAVTGDTVTISASAGGFNQAKNLLTTPGTIPNTDNIPTASISSDLTFTFNVAAATGSTIAAGTYTFQGGMFIDQDGSSRRLEISVSGISLTFDAMGNITSGSITAGTNAVVSGRSADGSATAVITLTNTLLNVTDSTFSITAGAQIAEIQGSASIILQDLTTTFTAVASYDYGIFLKQTGGVAGLTFGLTDGTTFFGCAAANPMALAGQSSFTGASALAGRMGVGVAAGGSATAYAGSCITVPAIGGGGGGAPPSNDDDTSDAPTVDEQQEAAQNSVNELNSIDFNDPTDDDIDTIVTVLNEIAQLGSNTAAGLEDGDVDTDGALNVVDTITDLLQVTGAATQGGGNIDSGAINDSLSGITDIFTALEGTGDGLDANQIEKVQTITETTVTAVTELFTETTSISDTESLIGNIGNIISSAINTGASLDTTLIADAQTLTQAALESTLSDIASALDSSLNVTFTDIASTQSLLRNNTRLLSAVLDTISIKISSSIKLDQTSTASTLEQAGVSTANAASLASDFAQFTNPDGISIATSSGTVSASDSFTNSFGGSFDLEVDSTTGVVDVKIGTDTYPVNIASVALVPDSIPDTAVLKSDGALLTISDGIATTSYPASRDPVAFASNLASLSSITDITISDITFAKNGGVQMSDGSSTFSGTFAFEPVDTTATSTGELTFSAPTGQPSDPSYSYKVNYPDGTSQNLLPFLADESIFDTLTDDYKVNYTTDRSTGVMNAGGIKFKPDYLLTPLDSDAQTYFDANKDASGFAYRAKSTDSEGVVTAWDVISSKGVQVIYVQ
jgi:hypothetical protein